MMGVTTLSLPSMIMLKKAIKPKLLNKKEKRRKIWDYLDLVREWKKKQREDAVAKAQWLMRLPMHAAVNQPL